MGTDLRTSVITLTKWGFKSHGRAMIGAAMNGWVDERWIIILLATFQVGVLGRRRINVGNVRHRLVANFDPLSPATNCH